MQHLLEEGSERAALWQRVYSNTRSSELKSVDGWCRLIFSNIGLVYGMLKRGIQIGINLIVILTMVLLVLHDGSQVSMVVLQGLAYKLCVSGLTFGLSWSFLSKLVQGEFFKNTIHDYSSKRADEVVSRKEIIDTTNSLIEKNTRSQIIIGNDQARPLLEDYFKLWCEEKSVGSNLDNFKAFMREAN